MIRRFLAAAGVALATVGVLPSVATAATQEFTLSASVDGLFPRADIEAPVTVHNPLPYAIAVHTADVIVGSASSSCPATNLTAQSFVGDVTIPRGGTAAVTIRMQMPASAPNACQGATFPLTFVASGEPLGVTPDARSRNSGFAFTGSDSAQLAFLGFAVVTGGAILVVASRRPRRTIDGRQ